MLGLSTNVDLLLLISIMAPRPAFQHLHFQLVGLDTLVLDTNDHGAGHGTSVFLQLQLVPLAFPVFLVLHGVESSGMKHAEAFWKISDAGCTCVPLWWMVA
jgi:hypothetical protein